MEFTVNQKEFLQVLAQAKAIGVSYIQLSHCENVLIVESFKSSKGLENKSHIQFHFIIPTTGLCVDGDIIVNVANLFSIIKNTDDEGGCIKIENKNKRDEFLINGSQLKIPTISKNEFMGNNENLYPKYKNFKKVDAKELIPKLKQVTTFCSKDPTKAVLKNVSIINNKTASTDGNRLYVGSLPIEINKEEPSQFFGKDVANLAKVLEKDKNLMTHCGMALDIDLSISWETKNGKKAIVHCSDNTTGQYPQYRNLMPTDKPTTTINVNTKSIKNCLKLLKSQQNNKHKDIVLKMSIENKNCTLSLITDNHKQAETSMDIDQEGENCHLVVNINYLYEAVNLCTSNTTMEIRGTSRPVILLSDFYYLLMPIALRN